MSTNTPFGSAGDPEYVGSASAGTATRTGGPDKKLGMLAAAAVAVVAVVGLGGWGAYTLLSGAGSQPADAVPASAVGYFSLDLDPTASQKIEAMQIFKKFPAIEKELDIGDRDDLRRYVFDLMQDDGVCNNLDYAEDVEPWIGERVAMAAVPDGKNKIAPLVVLQVSDQEAATTGIEALAKCGEAGDEFGLAFTGDYVLITDSEKKAESLAAAAEKASLADDAGFQEWTGAAGDPGVITMYASSEAPGYFIDLQRNFFGAVSAVEPATAEGMLAAPAGSEFQDDMDRMYDQMKELYKDFEGAAAVIRFEDGAMEMEFASKGMPSGMPASGEGSDIGASTLPANTGAAMSFTLPDGWVEDYLGQMKAMMGDDATMDDMLVEMEAQTGLSLPEDAEALLGDGVDVAVDSDADFMALMESEDPTQLSAGVKVHGNPDEILPVVDKLKANFGPQADILVVESSEDAVAFGFDKDYVTSILEEGELGDDDSFQNVVPEADKANGVFYVNFDAGDGWVDKLAADAGEGDPEVAANLKPLDALGASSWFEDDVQHGLFRMTMD